MKIAGIYPCEVELDPKVQHAVSEPYGLEMILALAKEDGHDVELFMPFKEKDGKIIGINEEEMIDNIINYEPNVAAFSMFTCHYPKGKRIASKLKDKVNGIVNVAGNRYVSSHNDSIDNQFDYYVMNEGELIFRDLLKKIDRKENCIDVKGLVYRKDDNIIFTGLRGRNFDLDDLPNALRFSIILNQSYKGMSIPTLNENPSYAIMETSRGCFFDCNFCDVPGFYGNKLVFKSISKVIDEMNEIKEKGVDIMYFMDLNFTASSSHVLNFCNEIIDRDLDFNWYCMSNIDSIDKHPELLPAMKEAGCYKIAYGVESTNNTSLNKMNKGLNKNMLTYQQASRVLEKSMNSGIINQGYYIIGFPWETEESMLKDAEELKGLALHHINIGIFTPIPLSKLHRDMLNEGYVFDNDLQKHDRNHLVFNHPYASEEILKYVQEKIHSDFYESSEFKENAKTICRIDERFIKSFNDYFEYFGKNIKIGIENEVII